jgi:hypothetical protein
MGEGTFWELSCHNSGVDRYRIVKVSEEGVKMRWSMISIKHGNDDPKKAADLRHTKW